jgi:hypothetical protein
VEPPAEEPPAESTARAEPRGDVLFEINGSLQVGDISAIHPGARKFRRAAANTAGAAVAYVNEQKRRQHRRQGPTRYLFVPLTLETYGRLGKPLMRLLGDVGQLAPDRGQGLFTKQELVRGAARTERLPLPIQRGAGAWCGWLLCQSQWQCHQAWPESAFGGCLGHGLVLLGLLGCRIGLAVVSVMSKNRFRCHSVSTFRVVLPLVQETAFLGVRVCACWFGSVI